LGKACLFRFIDRMQISTEIHKLLLIFCAFFRDHAPNLRTPKVAAGMFHTISNNDHNHLFRLGFGTAGAVNHFVGVLRIKWHKRQPLFADAQNR